MKSPALGRIWVNFPNLVTSLSGRLTRSDRRSALKFPVEPSDGKKSSMPIIPPTHFSPAAAVN